MILLLFICSCKKQFPQKDGKNIVEDIVPSMLERGCSSLSESEYQGKSRIIKGEQKGVRSFHAIENQRHKMVVWDILSIQQGQEQLPWDALSLQEGVSIPNA